jgi:hypothetical protein
VIHCTIIYSVMSGTAAAVQDLSDCVTRSLGSTIPGILVYAD